MGFEPFAPIRDMPAFDIQNAIGLLEQGRTDEAVPLLRRLIDTAPAYVTAYVLLARSYEAQQQWREALEVWQRAQFLMPNSPTIREGVERMTVRMTVPSWFPRPGQEAPVAEEAYPQEAVSEAAPAAAPAADADTYTDADVAAAWVPPEEPVLGVHVSGDEEPVLDVPAPPGAEAAVSWHEPVPPEDDDFVDLTEPPAGADTTLEGPPLDDAEAEDAEVDDAEVDDAEVDDTEAEDILYAGPPILPETPSADAPSEEDAEEAGEAPSSGVDRAAEDFADLDRLIDELESARIVPRPDLDVIPPPELEDDIEDMVSETLARIYASQGQYDEAARVFELLSAQQPDRAEEFLGKAEAMRARAADR